MSLKNFCLDPGAFLFLERSSFLVPQFFPGRLNQRPRTREMAATTRLEAAHLQFATQRGPIYTLAQLHLGEPAHGEFGRSGSRPDQPGLPEK